MTKLKPIERYDWHVFECGSEVASASGSAADSETAESEMMHYVMMYGQDGPVRFRMECDGEVLTSGTWDKLAALKKGPVYTASGG